MNALDKAKAIVAASEHVTYPSGAAARHVRSVMRELIEIIEQGSGNVPRKLSELMDFPIPMQRKR